MRVLIAFLLSIAAVAAAQQYYADVSVSVATDGSATIDGTTNHPSLQGVTQNLTSKKESHWLFNLTLPDDFSTYVIKVVLPQNAVLNYASGKGITITSSGNRVTITQIGSGKLSLAVQYQLEEQQRITSLLVTVLASFATVIAFGLFMLFAYKHGQKRVKGEMKKTLPEYINGLPQRQREIVHLLKKAGGQLTQKQLEERMSIPKSSISRNVDGLSRKGIVERQSLGLSNIVRLK